MRIVGTEIKEEGGESPAVRVEFSGDGGEIISVRMRRDDDLSRDNAIARARALMTQIGNSRDDLRAPGSI